MMTKEISWLFLGNCPYHVVYDTLRSTRTPLMIIFPFSWFRIIEKHFSIVIGLIFTLTFLLLLGQIRSFYNVTLP